MSSFIINRLREMSTWKGLVMVLSALGVTLSPDQIQAIIAAGLALVGVIDVFRKERR